MSPVRIFIFAIGTLALAATACGGSATEDSTPTAINRITPSADVTFVPGAGGVIISGTPIDGTPRGAFAIPIDGTPIAGFGPGQGFSFGGNTPIAEFLGVTEDELAAALQEEGATLASVAEDLGKTRDELKAFFIDDAEDRLAAEVEAGALTQEEMDAQIDRLARTVDMLLDSKGGQVQILVPEPTP